MVEFSVNGDEIWGHVEINGERYGRGGHYYGRIESEELAMNICKWIREALPRG